MKKSILILGLVVSGITASFAHDRGDISNNVITSFSKDFANAREVRWDNTKDFVKATFSVDNQVMFAYYAVNGDLIAVTKYLSPAALPINQNSSLKKNYGNYWISDLFELNAGNESSYFVTLEDENTRLILKSVNSSDWEVYRKEKK